MYYEIVLICTKKTTGDEVLSALHSSHRPTPLPGSEDGKESGTSTKNHERKKGKEPGPGGPVLISPHGGHVGLFVMRGRNEELEQ
jgi:hypothetical protein